MGPDHRESGQPSMQRLAATDDERERVAAAERAGWVFRFDPVRLEFTATRETRTARKIGALLDLVEAADAKAADRAD